jgi:hypothetical protein
MKSECIAWTENIKTLYYSCWNFFFFSGRQVLMKASNIKTNSIQHGKLYSSYKYEGVSKSFRTGRLGRELQMVQVSAIRCSFIAILWVSLVRFAAITLCVASQRVFICCCCCLFCYRLSPETFGYTVVHLLYEMFLAILCRSLISMFIYHSYSLLS